ncbi:MAG: ABC transporter ATP-binding protein [Kordiimonadaceae bacterium]|jgi:lipoprotein-releasing system ATP-binding protein|nr:ABC transporter ATP-binding protein [Kordiimonadaceae bacterium]MBT6037163.1 ABC transporter ATP-binding protein [Kordiimonadaceae bacterium]MBT7583633.1 ABC transporter ATP-binding protein [Kordiimonadaceae bacterium]
MSNIVELTDIYKSFDQGIHHLEILKGISLNITSGEVVALVGASGAGKSTLLHIMGLLERADNGDVVMSGIPTKDLSDIKRTKIRRNEIGFIYQFHNLLPEFNALENVIMPQLIAGVSKKDAGERAKELLIKMGLEERLDHRPAELSGGEQQRVAIARGLANRPRLILADEPTGNLDEKTGYEVMDVMLELSRDEGVSALIATHNTRLAARMDRVISLKDGVVV